MSRQNVLELAYIFQIWSCGPANVEQAPYYCAITSRQWLLHYLKRAITIYCTVTSLHLRIVLTLSHVGGGICRVYANVKCNISPPTTFRNGWADFISKQNWPVSSMINKTCSNILVWLKSKLHPLNFFSEVYMFIRLLWQCILVAGAMLWILYDIHYTIIMLTEYYTYEL